MTREQNAQVSLPRLIKVWPDLGLSLNLGRVDSYQFANKLPKGILVRLNRRLRVDSDKLREWLSQGGHSLPTPRGG